MAFRLYQPVTTYNAGAGAVVIPPINMDAYSIIVGPLSDYPDYQIQGSNESNTMVVGVDSPFIGQQSDDPGDVDLVLKGPLVVTTPLPGAGAMTIDLILYDRPLLFAPLKRPPKRFIFPSSSNNNLVPTWGRKGMRVYFSNSSSVEILFTYLGLMNTFGATPFVPLKLSDVCGRAGSTYASIYRDIQFGQSGIGFPQIMKISQSSAATSTLVVEVYD